MDLALLIVRAAVGLGFAAHGAQKLFGVFGGYGLAGTGGFFESIGLRPGKLVALAAGIGEFAGGLLLAFGLFGPVGPMLVIAVMTAAWMTVHAPNGFFAQNNGFELPFVYIALAVTYAFVGFGAYSLDALLGLSGVFTPSLAAAAVVVGFVAGLANVVLRRKPASEAPAS